MLCCKCLGKIVVCVGGELCLEACKRHTPSLRGTKQSLHMLIKGPVSPGYLLAACSKPNTFRFADCLT